MARRTLRPGGITLGLIFALLASSTLLPVANAQTQLDVRSVGEIFVDASGRASGQNVAAAIDESRGVLSGFTALALDTEIFGAVEIEGFAQAEKIQGVGSSSILLRGSNAVVSVYDNINSEFRIQATSPTKVRYALGDDMRTQVEDRHLVHVYTSSGAYLGSLVALGANGAAGYGDGFNVAGDRIEASVTQGAQVMWTARPVYVSDAAYTAAVVSSLADGYLSSKIVTEFSGSAQAQSKIDYFSNVQSWTTTTQDGAVESTIRSRASSSTMIAYDLAYESLPAQDADDVAVYVDGQIAARANSAAEVQDYAAAGVASFYATAQNGRSQILASTPDFRSSAEHRITLVAHAEANSESQARADSQASADSRAVGQYEYHANGKLTGLFTTSILDASAMAVHDFTALESRTEVFDSISVGGGAAAEYTNVLEHSVTLEGPDADVTLVDDHYATMIIDARESTDAVLNLGPDVKAAAEAANVIRLTGPNGFIGTLIVAQAQGAIGGGAGSPPPSPPPGEEPVPITTSDDGSQVRAELEQGSRLVFRSEQQGAAHASENVVTQAIASGQIGAQFLAGIQGNAAAAHSVTYSKHVDADVVTASRGSFVVDYTPRFAAAKTFVFDSRGTALAAKHASDVKVLVNGHAATAVGTPAAVIAHTQGSAFFVDSTLQGQLRVLVNTATAANQKATVTIESQVDATARAKANSDSFGVFKLFQGGTAVGSFVSLKANQQAGVVNDFTMMSTGQTVFKSIQAGASPFVSAGAEGTSQILLENRESRMEFTDTTSAYMRVVAEQSTNANFVVAPDVRAEQRSQNVIELTSESGDYLGSMIITDIEGRATAASYFQHTTGDKVQASLAEGAQVIFRTHVGIEAELSGAQRNMINHAIAAGRVAGQVLVQSQASLSAVAHAQANAEAQAQANLESTSYTATDIPGTALSAVQAQGTVTTAVTASYFSDVQMVTAATKDRVDVTVSSTTELGKTIIVSLDPATLPTMSTGDAEILVDGRFAAQASSYADILNPNDDNGVYEYFVLAGEAGTQVLVSMPHFSTHTVTLKAREASAPPIFMYATIFLGALVAVESVMLVRRRTA